MSKVTKPTQDQIAKWKEEFGEDALSKITSEDELYSCIIRRPKRHELGAAQAKSRNNSMAFNKEIVNACWLWGDEEMRKEDKYFYGLCEVLDDIIGTAKAEVEKL